MTLDPEPIEEYLSFPSDFSQEDLAETILRLLDHLRLEAIRTNRTKHGNVEIELRPRDE